jgi:hypothetical protein
MTTILAVYTSQGCIGRCDANCYNAKHSKCKCICGSRNHSAGKARAMENAAESVGLTPEDLDRFAKAHNLDPKDLAVIDRTKVNNRRARRMARNRITEPELPL